MLVSIGILAHNEERDIGNLISDVSKQTLLQSKSMSLHIHVVANGCTDVTVHAAEAALIAPSFQRENIKTFVHDLPRPGKSNAWNEPSFSRYRYPSRLRLSDPWRVSGEMNAPARSGSGSKRNV